MQIYDTTYSKFVSSLISHALNLQQFTQPSHWLPKLQRNISELKSICLLPSVYKECLKETIRRKNFVQKEYHHYITTINQHLATLQEEENAKRDSFISANSLETDPLAHLLLQQLFPFLKIKVPRLEISSQINQCDTQLPAIDLSRYKDLSYVLVDQIQYPLDIQDIDTESESEETEAEISLDSSIIDSTFDFEVVASPSKKEEEVGSSIFQKDDSTASTITTVQTSKNVSSMEDSSVHKGSQEQETLIIKSRLIEEQTKHKMEVTSFQKKIEELELENENSQKSVEQFLSQYLSASGKLETIQQQQQAEIEKLKEIHAKEIEQMKLELQKSYEEKLTAQQNETELLKKRVSELTEEHSLKPISKKTIAKSKYYKLWNS